MYDREPCVDFLFMGDGFSINKSCRFASTILFVVFVTMDKAIYNIKACGVADTIV